MSLMNPTTIVTKITHFVRGRIRMSQNKCPNCGHKFGVEDRTWCKMHDGATSSDSVLWLNYRQSLSKK